MRACVSCVDMFPHLHSQLCLPDAPISLNSSVGLDLKGKGEPGSSVRRPSCAYFQTPWSCLSHKPNTLRSLSLHPGSASCPTFKQRHLFSSDSELFNPSHPCTGLLFDTVNEGFVLIHDSHTPWSPSIFLSGLCLRVFHTQSLTHRTYFVDRKTRFRWHSPQTQGWLFLAPQIPVLSSPPLPDAFWRTGSTCWLVS